MNPLNYLHLAQPAVDVRGSHIAVYFTFDPNTRTSSTIVLNFQDGRWSKVVEEPILRVREGLEQGNRTGCGQDPFIIQAVLLTSALRWWSNVLSSFNDQLISYVGIDNCLFGSLQVDSNSRRSSYSWKKNRVWILELTGLFTAWPPIFTVTGLNWSSWRKQSIKLQHSTTVSIEYSKIRASLVLTHTKQCVKELDWSQHIYLQSAGSGTSSSSRLIMCLHW